MKTLQKKPKHIIIFHSFRFIYNNYTGSKSKVYFQYTYRLLLIELVSLQARYRYSFSNNDAYSATIQRIKR